MLEPLLGSVNRERVMIFLLGRGSGYAREIARFFEAGLAPVQQQLERLEYGGVIVSKRIGKTLLYQFNPRYPFQKELIALLEKALSFYPEDFRQRLVANRRRPRRAGKPIQLDDPSDPAEMLKE